MQRRGQFLNRAVERSSSDPFSTASANLPSTTPAHASPAQAAAQSNPHKRRTAHQPPRVPSSEAFGRRPAARLHRSTTGRHPKPFTIPVIPASMIEPRVRLYIAVRVQLLAQVVGPERGATRPTELRARV